MAMPLPLGPDEGVVAEAIQYASALHRRGMLAEAEKFCVAVLEAHPGHFDALYLLGVLHQQQGNGAEAMRLISAALKMNPRSVEALCSFGGVLTALGRHDEALDAYDKAISIKARHLEALNNRAHLLVKLGRYDEALASYGMALRIAPEFVSAFNKLGNNLLVQRRHEEAVAAFENALAITTVQLDIVKHRGVALRALGRRGDTLDVSDEALTAEALYYRGVSLCALENYRQAIESLERAASHPRALSVLAHCRLTIADWAQAEKHAEELRTDIAEGNFVDPLLPMAFGFHPLDQLRAAKGIIRHLVSDVPKPLIHPPATHAAKLRIAYLSSDFRQHPVGLAIAELFERHDKARFELVGVSFGPDDASGIRGRIIDAFDRFHDVASSSDLSTAGLLRDLEVHIAVDLNGLTGSGRPGILAHRPAPIQVSYLGYAGTTGADFIDYILADETALPLDQQPFFTEMIVHLPDCYFANDTTRRPPPQIPARADLGLPEQDLIFCCFNKSYKITAPVFDIWMRLLRQVPGSVLWLSTMNDLARANVRREAAARGVNPERLIFAPRMDRIEDHLARHRAADIFLDTLPYNAHSTACDALWAGLPVVTCAGNAFAGRVGASMVKAAGLPELATNSLEEYEALALSLATDPTLLSSIRRKLEAKRLACPLFDSDRFRRHIEAAYATMWDIHRRNERPRSFRVAPVT